MLEQSIRLLHGYLAATFPFTFRITVPSRDPESCAGSRHGNGNGDGFGGQAGGLGGLRPHEPPDLNGS